MLKLDDVINGYRVLQAHEFNEGTDFGVILAHHTASEVYVTAGTTPHSLAAGQWSNGFYTRDHTEAFTEYSRILEENAR